MTSKQDDNGEKGGVSPGWQRMSTHAMRRLDLLVQARVGKNLAGRFQIERLLAMGGMAAVYEAMQRPLNRRVAVKVLHPSEIEAGRRD
jgi:serine/threonine protein kinase